MTKGQVIVTGTKENASDFALRLQEAGFKATPLATIRITKKALSNASIAALKGIESYDYLLFTSTRAVNIFDDAMRELWIRKPQKSSGVKIVAVGPATAQALQAIGLSPHLAPKEFNAREMVREMARAMTAIAGTRILFPASAIASKETSHALEALGARVTSIPLYTTAPLAAPKKVFQDLVKDDGWIIFMSPSSVAGFVKNLDSTILKEQVRSIRIVCIGPTTARAASKAGFRHIVIAKPSTTDGIIKTLQKFF